MNAGPSAPARSADVIRSELMTGVDPKAADERLLVQLAADAAAIALHVGTATDRLAQVIPGIMADPKKAVAVAKVLHDLVVVGNTLARRVEGTLATAATLRLQRRLHRAQADGF